MSWPMPTSGPWNPGVGQSLSPMITPDMGNYTQDQWALMQQQNWQQWAQWQQQYAQWQTQFGDKYTQQMQAMQMGGPNAVPPPPSNAPPPAPPPPDNPPPPPPPHENDQPLFGSSQGQPPPPRNSALQNIDTNIGNDQQWSYSETKPPVHVNAEALNKLAEEERLFDIQFQKWEEEIEKWKRENVNHPDKKAYDEYEKKFETCRVQLLERRQQMNQNRAKLLGTAPPTSNIPVLNNQASIPPSNANNAPSVQHHQQPPHANRGYGDSNTQQHSNVNMGFVDNNSQIPQNVHRGYGDKQQPSNVNRDYVDNISQKQPNQNRDYADKSSLQSSNMNRGYPDNNSNQNYNNRNMQQPPNMNRGYGDNKMNRNYVDNNNQMNRGYGDNNNQMNRGYGDNNQMNRAYGDNNNHMNRGYSDNNSPMRSNANRGYGENKTQLLPNPSRSHGDKNQPQNFYHNSNQNHNNKNNTQNQNYNDNDTMIGHNRRNIRNIELQENLNSPPFKDNDSQDTTQFLPSSGQSKGIPGLDLVPEDKSKPTIPTDVIDITEDNNDSKKGPDYSTISKGINHILGDAKIMNILSMVQGQQGSSNRNTQLNTGSYNVQNSQWSNNAYNNQQFDNKQNQFMQQAQGPVASQSYPPPLMQQLHFPPAQQGYAQGPPLKPVSNDRQFMQQNQRFDQNNSNEQDYDDQNYPNNRGMQDIRSNRTPMQPGNNINPPVIEPVRPKWDTDPLFTPSIIVEYEHKPLRLKARDFIEPVHTFDYNHKSKDEEFKRKDFEREVDEELFSRKNRRPELEDDLPYNRRGLGPDRYVRERELGRDYERRGPPRDDARDDWRSRLPRDSHDERRRPDDRQRIEDRSRLDDRSRYDDRQRLDDRRRDDRERYSRRDDVRRDDVRDRERDRHRDTRRDDRRSRSRDRDVRKRAHSIDSDCASKKSKETASRTNEAPKHIVMIDDLLEPPGRDMRPEKIVVILRGPPGSGKSYLAKLIRDREAEFKSTARILSIDDYFMQESEIEEKDPATGKIVKKPSMKYEYDEKAEESYMTSLKRAFKRTITDGYFNFLIYDAVNESLKSYADMWNFARQNGFQVYICTLERDPQTCYKRNVHNRTLEQIEVICTRFFDTPPHHIQLDATTLLQNAAITDVHMEDVDDDVIMEDAVEAEVETSFTSKWEKMDDASQLARLDGTSRPLRPSVSMEDYLQLDDWQPTTAKPGKKSVRWADIEENRKQEKMRAIGFVVGQTDWNRMTDPTMGSSALTQTKYIERVRRN